MCKRGISCQLKLAPFACDNAGWGILFLGYPSRVCPQLSPMLSWLSSPQEDDESSQCSADFDLSLPDNGFMSKNEVIRSKVSRLTERLRKRCPSNNFGKAGSGCCLELLSRAGSVLLTVVTTELGGYRVVWYLLGLC